MNLPTRLNPCHWNALASTREALINRTLCKPQKSYTHLEHSCGASHRDAFGTRGTRLRMSLQRHITPRVENPKIKTLLIFHCRRSIWIKHVTFVEQCLRDLVHSGKIHNVTFSSREEKMRS